MDAITNSNGGQGPLLGTISHSLSFHYYLILLIFMEAKLHLCIVYATILGCNLIIKKLIKG